MPGCHGCNRGCPGYRQKDIFSQELSRLEGGAFNGCAICQCHLNYHY